VVAGGIGGVDARGGVEGAATEARP
jgi:hypothetical protein